MSKMGMTLEIELQGLRVVKKMVLTTLMLIVQNYIHNLKEVAYAYEELSKINPRFTIAAAFGNITRIIQTREM
jgi:fructose-bisphosphate aldolase class II